MTESMEIAERALEIAGADEAEVLVMGEQSGFARFAAGEVHQPTLIDNVTVQLRVVSGGRSAAAVTNRTDDEGFETLARRAAEAAASASPDPELPPLAPPAEFPDVEGYDEETAALGSAAQAGVAETAIAAAGDFGLYGFFTSGVTELAVASTTGLRAAERKTDATCMALAAVDGASGYATRTAWRAGELDPAAVAEEAVEKAARTRGAVDAPPARYRAVLEPYAIGELLYYTAFDMFNGLALPRNGAGSPGGSGSRRLIRR